LKFQVSPAAPWDGDHSEGETFGRRIQKPESRIQKEGARSQETGDRRQKRNSEVRCEVSVIRTRKIGSSQHQ
jgi:hypothetical protein